MISNRIDSSRFEKKGHRVQWNHIGAEQVNDIVIVLSRPVHTVIQGFHDEGFIAGQTKDSNRKDLMKV